MIPIRGDRRRGPTPLVFADADALARAVAGRFVEISAQSLARHGEFRTALSGGRSPAGAYRILGGEWRDRVDWSRATILFADERAVPPDHPDSNYRLVREALLEPAGVPAERVQRMRGEADDLEVAARAYETHLVRPADLLVLGIGPDGHTASIFPGSEIVREAERRVRVEWASPKPPPRRLTITPRVIAEAGAVMVVATGADKAEVVARAIAGADDPARLPAVLLTRADWYLDRDAASRILPPSSDLA